MHELRSGDTRMVIATAPAPRIAWFGFADGDNFLFWDHAREHRRGAWELLGGHRMWVTRPGADESEEIYLAEAEATATPIEGGLTVTAPATALGIEKSFSITAQAGVWQIEHRVRNAGELLWSGGIWALTCTVPARNSVYRIPLGGGPAGWDSTTIVIPTKWGGDHTSRLDDPQIVLERDAMRIEPSGEEGKRMVLAPQGVLEMTDPSRGTFRKHASFDPEGSYPLGTNLAVYLGPRRFMVELESMGPARTLAPGATLVHRETWTLERPSV